MVGLYRDQVLPRIQNRLMDLGGTREVRARVCAGLAGDVVEIGFGSGLNLPYLPAEVDALWAIEPAQVGRRLSAGRRAASRVPVTFAGLDGQRLPFDDDSFDAALTTWTLCTIPDPVAALRELRRVLRPGGQVHFVEHGISPDRSVAGWQHRCTPLQRKVAGGCHLDRDIPALFAAGGFTVTRLDTYYEKGAPRVLGHMFEGRAGPA